LVNAAGAQELVGIPTITDGDTVVIGHDGRGLHARG
jgi:hypothetical protein